MFNMFMPLLLVTSSQPTQPPIVEVVMYHIATPLATIQQIVIGDINRHLEAKAAGFQHRLVLQSVQDPNWLVDWVVWDNLPNALAAAQAMPAQPEFQSFLQQIDSMRGMWHAKAITSSDRLPNTPAVVEVVIYELKPGASAVSFHQAYAQGLASIPGYMGRHVYQDTEQSNRYIEYVAWASRTQAEAAPKLMEANPSIAAAFAAVAKVELMELFVPVS